MCATDSFPCNRCGACCKSIRLLEETVSFDRGDGVCRHFDDTQNVCAIYEKRPEICNVQLMYEKHYKDQYKWTEFVSINQKACKILLLRMV